MQPFCFSILKALIIKLLVLLPLVLLRGQNPAQHPRNLVTNPSFEVRSSNKTAPPFIQKVDSIAEFFGWSAPTVLQGEVFDSEKTGFVHDETLFDRPFKAVTGTHVGHIIPFGWFALIQNKNNVERTYLMNDLKSPLEVGQKYYVGFYLHFHCLATSNVGIAVVLPEMIKDTSLLLSLEPAVYSRKVNNYDKNHIWEFLLDSFVANYPATRLVIGNFFNNKETAIGGSLGFGHYRAFVDDVFLIKANDSKMPPPKPKPLPPPPPPLPKVLNRVQFKYNSTEFEANSFVQLDSCVLTLQRFPNLKILIKGHSSGEGDATKNQNLSERRAQAVKNYLISKGIAAERLQTKGFGTAQLLVVEKTEDDRKVNRRIEFEILAE